MSVIDPVAMLKRVNVTAKAPPTMVRFVGVSFNTTVERPSVAD